MKVVLSTVGKFHTFDLARVFTGHPHFKLRKVGLPKKLIRTFPWVHGAYMAFPWKHRLPRSIVHQWENINAITFGAWVARALPVCDLYVGLSGATLPAGKKAHLRGARYVCDRGSSHIQVQDQLLREEHDLWGLPYGVKLSRFQPVAEPAAGRFDVLFVGGMSLRKGVQYLMQAYKKLNHPAKSLTFAGVPSQELIALLTSRGLWPSDARVLGHVPQTELKSLMSRSHVMVLPSIQEGFGMVLAQAMACGCPVVASSNTGSEDLFSDGQEGFIVPIRDVDSLATRLQQLADQTELRAAMGRRALERVQSLGGWRDYGQKAMAIYDGMLKP